MAKLKSTEIKEELKKIKEQLSSINRTLYWYLEVPVLNLIKKIEEEVELDDNFLIDEKEAESFRRLKKVLLEKINVEGKFFSSQP